MTAQVIVTDEDGTVMEFWLGDDYSVAFQGLSDGSDAVVIAGRSITRPSQTNRSVVTDSGDVLGEYDPYRERFTPRD